MTRKTITTLLLCLATACLSLTATAQNYLQHRPNNFANDTTELDDSATGMAKYLEWKRQREVQYAKEDQDEVRELEKTRKQILDTIAKAEFIIEGRFIKGSHYMRNERTALYSNIFKIEKVLRGKLKPGTVEIVSYCDNCDFIEKEERPYSFNNDTGNTFIIVCKTSKEFPFDVKYNIDDVSNKIILQEYNNFDGFSIDKFDVPSTEFKIKDKADLFRILLSADIKKNGKLSKIGVIDSVASTKNSYGLYNAHRELIEGEKKKKRITEDTTKYRELVKKKSNDR